MNFPDPPVTPRPAATILLVRDGNGGIEVFMATRHQDSSFMPGLLVFPGGRVDPADSDPRILAGLAAEDRALDDLASRIGGIREVFEESCFLFAREAGGASIVGAARLDALAAAYRSRIHRREITLADMIEAEKLALAPRLLVPFAHWVTPRIRSKRFDTRFYLAAAPHGQEGTHDDRELVDSRWVRPLDAVAEADRGLVRLAFVTRSNLKLLARSATVSEALGETARRRIVTVSPELFDSPEGPALRIPADAGYDVTEVLVKDTGAG
jgi:8-oxo-dGTP pyrophosphatase MutT (NUDIX family)